jgi:hypothetical protein
MQWINLEGNLKFQTSSLKNKRQDSEKVHKYNQSLKQECSLNGVSKLGEKGRKEELVESEATPEKLKEFKMKNPLYHFKAVTHGRHSNNKAGATLESSNA